MTLDEAIKDIEYGTKQLEMEIESGLWIKGSEPELRCKEGIALNKQHIEWLTELKKAKQFLKVAVKDFRILGTMLEDGLGRCTAKISCDKCVLGGGNLADDCQWRYAAEALALIGKDIDVPATEDDTNVGRKQEG